MLTVEALFSPAFAEHPEGPSFTLDLITREDGALLFLEGGPAAMRAAHPCCFLNEETGEIAGDPPLHGVAFAVGGPCLPLREIGVDPDALPDLVGASQPGPEDWAEPETEGPTP